jgi:hypothetical protein
MRSPAKLKLSGFAKGPATSTAKATLDMSQKYFARFSRCFLSANDLHNGYECSESSTSPKGRSMLIADVICWKQASMVRNILTISYW